MKIEDNFLEQTTFNELQSLIMAGDFAWYYNPLIVHEREIVDEKQKDFQFIHTYYWYNSPQSSHYSNLLPIIDKLGLYSLAKIKSNLLTRTSNIVKHTFHIDIEDMSKEKQKQWTTSIFYINTNNGYTEFEDGTKVESVANRLVSFPANLKHRGTSCTDEKTRVVINFNYFK